MAPESGALSQTQELDHCRSLGDGKGLGSPNSSSEDCGGIFLDVMFGGKAGEAQEDAMGEPIIKGLWTLAGRQLKFRRASRSVFPGPVLSSSRSSAYESSIDFGFFLVATVLETSCLET